MWKPSSFECTADGFTWQWLSTKSLFFRSLWSFYETSHMDREETVFWKFLVVFSLQYCLSLCWLWIIWTFVPFPNRKFSKSTMTEANCGRIKKERLDWDFLQALVKMNTAVNPTLPVILPFSSMCHRTGLVQVREPPKNWFIYFHLILKHTEDI